MANSCSQYSLDNKNKKEVSIMFRKILSLALVLSICFSFTSTAFAADRKFEAAEVENIEVITEAQREVMRVEDVKVEGILEFSDEALCAVETYVTTDENGRYYVENEEELRAVLTEAEYLLVLEQIEIVNDDPILVAAANGTEGSPYILTPGVAFSTSASGASSTWFQASGIRGATDFIVSSSKSASVTIYKKNLIGKTQIGNASGTSVNTTISASATNNNSNNYLVNVAISSAMTSSITVRQHTDSTTTYYSGGTVWKPYNLSAIPDTNLLTMKMWYLKVDEVDKLSTFVNNSNYIQYVDAFMAGTMTAASIAVAIWGLAGGGTAPAVIGIAMTLISNSTAGIFRKAILDNLNSAGGWNGTKFTKPVYMKQVFSTSSALTFHYFYTWTGSTIYGEAGYTGSFSSNG
jgi:hypothetical protein